MKKINIYLDDLRDCPSGFVLAKNIEEAKELIKDNNVGIISLDHDLGVDKRGKILPSGYDLVKHMVEFGVKCDSIYLHTDNPVGRDNMYQTLNAAKRRGFKDDNISVYRYGYTKNTFTK